MMNFEDLRKTYLFYIGRLRYNGGWLELRDNPDELTPENLSLAPTCFFDTTAPTIKEILELKDADHFKHYAPTCSNLFTLLDKRVPEPHRSLIAEQWAKALSIVDKIPFPNKGYMVIQPDNTFVSPHVHPDPVKTIVTIAFKYPTKEDGVSSTKVYIGKKREQVLNIEDGASIFSIRDNQYHCAKNTDSWAFFWAFDYTESFDYKDYLSDEDLAGIKVLN